MERSKVRISELLSYFEHSMAHAVADEGLSYFMVNKTWKVWICPSCDDKFSVSEHIWEHVVQKHIGTFSPEVGEVLPLDVGSKWAEKILYSSWQPVDVVTAFKKFEKPGIEKVIDSWSLLDDTNREGLLEKIREKLDFLIKQRYMSASHLKRIIRFSSDEINRLAAGTQRLNLCLEEAPLFICCLGPTELGKILEFLSELSHTVCDLRKEEDKNTNSMVDFKEITETEIEGEITVSDDGLCLSISAAKITSETGASDDRSQLDSHLDRWVTNKFEGLKLVGILKDKFGQLKNEESNFLELSDDDRSILRQVAIIEALKNKLCVGSSMDYHAVLLPELKIYLQHIRDSENLEALESEATKLQDHIHHLQAKEEDLVQHTISIRQEKEGLQKKNEAVTKASSKLRQSTEIRRLESGVSEKRDRRRNILKNKKSVEGIMNGRKIKLLEMQILLDCVNKEIEDVTAEISIVEKELSTSGSDKRKLEEELRRIDEEIKGDLNEIAEKREQIAK